MPDNERKRFCAPDSSRCAVELKETSEVRLISSGGEQIPGHGLLLGWLDDHTLVWYENKENKLIDQLFH